MKATELSDLPIQKNFKKLASEELSNIKRIKSNTNTRISENFGAYDDTIPRSKSKYQKYQLFLSFLFFFLGIFFLYYIFSYIYSQYVRFCFNYFYSTSSIYVFFHFLR